MDVKPLALGFVLLTVPLVGCISTGGSASSESLEIKTLVRGADSPITEPEMFLAQNASAFDEELSEIWSKHVGEDVQVPDGPEVDFEERMVAVVFAGEYDEACAGVEIEEITHHPGSSGEARVEVEATVLVFEDEALSCEASSPVHAVTVPNLAGEAVFETDEERVSTVPEAWVSVYEDDGEGHEAEDGTHVRDSSGVAFETLDKGADSGIEEEANMTVRSQEAWEELWEDHAGEERQIPEVDFEERMVIALFAGQAPNACHSIVIDQIVEEDEEGLLVKGGEDVKTDGACSQQITYPFTIVTLDRYEGEVTFEIEQA